MRIFRNLLLLSLMVMVALPQTANAARHRRHAAHGGSAAYAVGGERDPRYAAVIMNPTTGEIYYSRDAEGLRYPASLTKMMTLYLLFEDLQSGKVSMHDKFTVSEYASTMPRTNLSLQPGDELPVETAIKALIVLSANDAAVVVAENLADGSVSKFAERMTRTAHMLGMRNTVFKNPNGLPNDEQHTTALDMAKLGIALKRDFPQYYPYFSVRQFSWSGATHYTHNRVMLRYAGVDGIKTGYIGKSGFNLVTSCVRGGRPLVGAVMGGASGGWRDNQMIRLLDGGYRIIAERGQKNGRVYASNLPLPRPGTAAPAPAPAPVQVAMADAPPDNTILQQQSEEDESENDAAAPAPATAPASAKAPTVAVAAKPQPVAKATAPAKPQGGLTTAAASNALWGIQVGAFSSQALAEQAAKQAMSQASGSLQGSRMSVIGDGVHRARLENLSESQAKKACETLISQNSPCFIFRTDAQNL